MIIGVDVGGTKIAAGVVKNGKVLRFAQRETGAAKGKAFVLKQLRGVIDDIAKGERIDGVGIGVPGLYQGTRIVRLPNIPALNGVDLKRELRLRAPITLDNDARCFALAEQRHGAAKGKKDVVGIILGTGVGGGIIMDGKLIHGRGGAGEIGHMLCTTKELFTDCINGPGIARRNAAHGGKERTATDVWAARSRAAIATRKETEAMLRTLLLDIQAVLDPEMIVLGGGVSTPQIVKSVQGLRSDLGKQIIVKHGTLGINAGILGAAELFRER